MPIFAAAEDGEKRNGVSLRFFEQQAFSILR